MFSGIIEKLARVTLAAPRGGSLEIELESGWPDLSLDPSGSRGLGRDGSSILASRHQICGDNINDQNRAS